MSSSFTINRISECSCKPHTDSTSASSCLHSTRSTGSTAAGFSLPLLLDTIAKTSRIQCVLASTFRFDLDWIQLQFNPTIFSQRIPFLLLHGDRKRDRVIPNIENLFIEQVTTRISKNTSKISQGIDACSSRSTTSEEKEHLAGVHHSKYVIIVTDVSLCIVISTGNLTSATSIDASWHQTFNRTVNAPPNDFGVVLQDFIMAQSAQLVSNACANVFSVTDWLTSHCGVSDISTAFDFSTAKVKLVSTVPGRFLTCSSGSTSEVMWDPTLGCGVCNGFEPMHVRYGLERVSQIVKDNYSTHYTTGLSDGTDTLYIQPTSIGGGINNRYIGYALTRLLPESTWDNTHTHGARQDSYRLIWPTREWVNSCHRCIVTPLNSADEQMDDTSSENNEEEQFAAGLFLRADTLNAMEEDVYSQMNVYAPREELDGIAPHIKTLCRLGRSIAECGEGDCTCKRVLWLMLSSASLSHGALGREVYSKACQVSCIRSRRKLVEYKNFELGVVFTSKSERYLVHSSSCPTHPTSDDRDDCVFLPLPFKTDSDPYFSQNFDVLHTPYFSHRSIYGATGVQSLRFEVKAVDKRSGKRHKSRSSSDTKENSNNESQEDAEELARNSNAVDFLCD